LRNPRKKERVMFYCTVQCARLHVAAPGQIYMQCSLGLENGIYGKKGVDQENQNKKKKKKKRKSLYQLQTSDE